MKKDCISVSLEYGGLPKGGFSRRVDLNQIDRIGEEAGGKHGKELMWTTL